MKTKTNRTSEPSVGELAEGVLADVRDLVTQHLDLVREDLGQEIPATDQQSPEALRAFHKAEVDKWWPVIKSAGIKAD